MSNLEIFKLFRESNEANFLIFLENNIEWVEEDNMDERSEGEDA